MQRISSTNLDWVVLRTTYISVTIFLMFRELIKISRKSVLFEKITLFLTHRKRSKTPPEQRAYYTHTYTAINASTTACILHTHTHTHTYIPSLMQALQRAYYTHTHIPPLMQALQRAYYTDTYTAINASTTACILHTHIYRH